MRRFSFGIVLLTVLLACSLAVWRGMEAFHRPVVRELTRAAALAQEGDPAARETALRAKAQWQRSWHFTASFADHTPMEEVDDLFYALAAYDPDSEEFAACCLQLAQRTEAMIQAHAFSWWNLL